MYFEITSTKKLQKEIHTLIKKDLQTTLADIANPALTSDKKVHQVRKMCKRQRGLLQLLRPILKNPLHYQEENSFYKALAKQLATSRESKVMMDIFKLLLKNHTLQKKSFIDVEKALTRQNHNKHFSKKQLDQKLQTTQKEIQKSVENLKNFKLCSKNISSLKKGFQTTYKKSYHALKMALKNSDIEAFHTFRKFSKYHMYHTTLLSKKSILPKSRPYKLKKLTDILGVEHDLHLFEHYLITNQKSLPSVKMLLPYLKKEQKKLRKDAAKLEKKLFKLKAKELTQYLII